MIYASLSFVTFFYLQQKIWYMFFKFFLTTIRCIFVLFLVKSYMYLLKYTTNVIWHKVSALASTNVGITIPTFHTENQDLSARTTQFYGIQKWLVIQVSLPNLKYFAKLIRRLTALLHRRWDHVLYPNLFLNSIVQLRH